VSLETVHSWGTELRTKLNVRDTAGLVRHAVRSGLIKAAALWCATL
jgi:hypothetical protein